MADIHEVIGRDGRCLYRGLDVELACEILDAAPAGTHLHCRHATTDDVSAPVPYALTERAEALFVVDTTNVAELRDAARRQSRRPAHAGGGSPDAACSCGVPDGAWHTDLDRRAA